MRITRGTIVCFKHPDWGWVKGSVLAEPGTLGMALHTLVQDLGDSGAREYWPTKELKPFTTLTEEEEMLPEIRFINHYAGCEECLRVPSDLDDENSGDLCDKGQAHFDKCGYTMQTALNKLALQSMVAGAEMAEQRGPDRGNVVDLDPA